jgi:hypothetical protein
MTPHAAISAFLRSVQADDTEAAGEFAAAEPQLAAMLVDVATQIVVPVTALPGPDTGEASADTFALEALGLVFLTTLHAWEQTGSDVTQGIARAVIAFTEQILTEDHENVAYILRSWKPCVGQALEAHPAPGGAHPVRRTAV